MLRAQLSYYHAHKYGALGYICKDNYNNHHNHEKFIQQINDNIERNKNKLAVKHHKKFYGGKFPIWVIIELFTVGQLSLFYSDMLRTDKKAIAKNLYHTTDTNMASWLKCLTELRNNCAHYSRLYNSAQLPKELVSEFKEICKEKNISQASVFKSAIEKFIEENK